MKFKKSSDWTGTLKCEDKCGDVLTIHHSAMDTDQIFVHVNDSAGVQLKRRKAIKLALAILDELDPLHTWG